MNIGMQEIVNHLYQNTEASGIREGGTKRFIVGCDGPYTIEVCTRITDGRTLFLTSVKGKFKTIEQELERKFQQDTIVVQQLRKLGLTTLQYGGYGGHAPLINLREEV